MIDLITSLLKLATVVEHDLEFCWFTANMPSMSMAVTVHSLRYSTVNPELRY